MADSNNPAELTSIAQYVVMTVRDYSTAITKLDKALRIDPNYVPALDMRSRYYLSFRSYNESLRDSEHAITLVPNNSEIWVTKGIALTGLGRYDDALIAFDTASRLSPNMTSIYLYREIALVEKELASHEDNATAWYQRSLLLLNQSGKIWPMGYDHTNMVINSFNCSLTYDPNHADRWYQYGGILSFYYRWNESSDAYMKALEIDPSLAPDVWLRIGDNLGRSNHHEESISAYERALGLDPDNTDLLIKIAGEYNMIGNRDRAYLFYDNVTIRDPDNLNAWKNKKIYLRELNRSAELIPVYDNITRLDPNESFTNWVVKGDLLLEYGRYDDAVLAYDNVLTRFPGARGPDVFNNKGIALYHLGRYQEALQVYDDALTYFKGYTPLINGRKMVLDAMNQSGQQVR